MDINSTIYLRNSSNFSGSDLFEKIHKFCCYPLALIDGNIITVNTVGDFKQSQSLEKCHRLFLKFLCYTVWLLPMMVGLLAGRLSTTYSHFQITHAFRSLTDKTTPETRGSILQKFFENLPSSFLSLEKIPDTSSIFEEIGRECLTFEQHRFIYEKIQARKNALQSYIKGLLERLKPGFLNHLSKEEAQKITKHYKFSIVRKLLERTNSFEWLKGHLLLHSLFKLASWNCAKTLTNYLKVLTVEQWESLIVALQQLKDKKSDCNLDYQKRVFLMFDFIARSLEQIDDPALKEKLISVFFANFSAKTFLLWLEDYQYTLNPIVVIEIFNILSSHPSSKLSEFSGIKKRVYAEIAYWIRMYGLKNMSSVFQEMDRNTRLEFLKECSPYFVFGPTQKKITHFRPWLMRQFPISSEIVKEISQIAREMADQAAEKQALADQTIENLNQVILDTEKDIQVIQATFANQQHFSAAVEKVAVQALNAIEKAVQSANEALDIIAKDIWEVPESLLKVNPFIRSAQIVKGMNPKYAVELLKLMTQGAQQIEKGVSDTVKLYAIMHFQEVVQINGQYDDYIALVNNR
jgi:hypothetical protein